MQRFGFGIVGCGVIANDHAAAIILMENAFVAGVMDADATKAATFGERYGAPWFTSLEDLLSDPTVDVVCVCTPSGLHAAVGISAAAAGKHVIVEKPIDISLAAADRLIAACDRAKVTLGVVSQLRFAPGLIQAKKLVDEGAIGRLLVGDVQLKRYRSQAYYDNDDWRGTWELDGGGSLINQGIHYVDLLTWLMGPAESIAASCATVAHDVEVEDVAIAVVNFESGALGVIEVSTAVYPELPPRLEISGTRGSILLEGNEVKALNIEGNVGSPDPNSSGTMPTAAGSLHALQFRNTLEAIVAGVKPLVDGAAGRAALSVVLGAYEASKRRATVRLGEPSEPETAGATPTETNTR